jgi:hypothetical protein
MIKPFLLYHWSPTRNRRQIEKYGLRIHRLSRGGLWRPPFISLSNSPSWAWGSSADLREEEGEWDLWMVWSDDLEGYEKLPGFPCEYRIYHRIKQRYLWRVGTREYRMRKKRR